MATTFNHVPRAALPFLLARQHGADPELRFSTALRLAVSAERADSASLRNSRGRIAYILCELRAQLPGRRTFPLSRRAVADATGISLCRVKRALALLSLSQVVATDGIRIRVMDWRRLCGVAGYDCTRLGIEEEEAGDAITIIGDAEAGVNARTASGDPACFV